MEGATCRSLQEVDFPDPPSPDTIMSAICNLLERLIEVGLGSWSTYLCTTSLLALVRRLAPAGRLGKVHTRRLIRAIEAFCSLDELDYSLQALCTLHHLGIDVPAPDERLDEFLQHIVKQEEHGASGQRAFGTLFYSLVLKMPLLHRDNRLYLIQRCTQTISSSVGRPFAFIVDMMRGLARLEHNLIESEKNKLLLEALVTFLGRVAATDATLEVSSPTLSAIRSFIKGFPAAGAIIFMEKGGFKSAVAMMDYTFPRTDPPGLVRLLRLVLSSILELPESAPSRFAALKAELDETALFSNMLLGEHIFAETKASRNDGLYLLHVLDETIPGISGRETLYNALQ